MMIFHFQPELLPGGFAGVDVFFVISGYLMTKILLENNNHKEFELFNFYLSRANRILPALGVLCVSLLIFGWFNLLPEEYSLLGKHVRDSALFISNHTYYGEADYFNDHQGKNWLLHTWSLSIEWQFYIAYPLSIYFLYKINAKERIKNLILISCLCSFFWCIHLGYSELKSPYFLTSSRIWEFLLGGLAYFYSFNANRIVGISGWILIAISMLIYSNSNIWPGFGTILPVAGAFIVLISNNSDFGRNFLTKHIGLHSYSIYLWHWPIVVYYSKFNLSEYYWLLFGILLSISFGAISYHLIEKTRINKIINVSIYLLLLAATALIGEHIQRSEGIKERSFAEKHMEIVNYEQEYILRKKKQRELALYRKCWTTGIESIYNTINECRPNDKKKHNVLLIGDSHAAQYYNALKNKYRNINLHLLASNFCSLTGSKNDIKRIGCAEEIEYLNDSHNKSYDYVIVATRLFDTGDRLTKNLSSAIKKLSENIHVIVIGPIFYYEKNMNDIYIDNFHSNNKKEIFDRHLSGLPFLSDAALKEEVGDHHNVTYISTIEILCKNNECNPFDSNGNPMLIDSTHLSVNASREIVDKFSEKLPFN